MSTFRKVDSKSKQVAPKCSYRQVGAKCSLEQVGTKCLSSRQVGPKCLLSKQVGTKCGDDNTMISLKTSLPSPISVGAHEVQEFKFVKPTVEDNLKLARSSALSFLKSNEDVEDTEEYSDALVGLWNAVESWTPEQASKHKCTWSSYAIRCMRNSIVDGIRKRKHAELVVDFTEKQPIDHHSSIDHHSFNERLVKELFAVHSKDTFYDVQAKTVLYEYYIGRKRLKEIAIKLGLSIPRTAQLIQKAKRLLRMRFHLATQD